MLRHDFAMLPHCQFMTAPFQFKNLSKPFPENVELTAGQEAVPHIFPHH